MGVVVVACGGGSPAPAPKTTAVAYRLSTRGRRASRASKANAANKVFASRAAAEAGRAHPGENSRVVPIDLFPDQWEAWFGGGETVIDRRHRL